MYVHFEPIGHYTNNLALDPNIHTQDTLEDLYQQALSKAKGAKKSDSDDNLAMFPDYIEKGSLHSKRWMQTHQRTKLVSNCKFAVPEQRSTQRRNLIIELFTTYQRIQLDTSNLSVHTAAAAGDLEALIALAVSQNDEH